MKDKTILITGGTGSLGQALVKYALSLNPWRIIVYSRNEYDQFEMEQKFPDVTYVLGDICHLESLVTAFRDVDFVIHAAALKHVAKCEKNPGEAMRINVDGSRNVVRAAIECDVEKVLAISSDKAVTPINLYGATKLVADRYFLAANIYNHTRFAVVRFGNFADSRGSAGPLFRALKTKGVKPLPIRDKRMTRFYISLKDAAKFCFSVLDDCIPGGIYIPRMPSYRLVDLAHNIYPEAEIREVGIEPGEKIHEDLINVSDGCTIDCGHFFITLPARHKKKIEGSVVKRNIDSKENDRWITRFS